MLGQPSISIPQLLPTGTIQLSPQREPPGASLERLAGMFITQMQNMAAKQNKFFEFMLGPGTAGGRQLRSVESVQDVCFFGPLAEFGIASTDSRHRDVSRGAAGVSADTRRKNQIGWFDGV